MTEILNVTFHLLQDRWFFIIWVVAENEGKNNQKMVSKGYRMYRIIIWLKSLEKQILVNFMGKLQRHSTKKRLFSAKETIGLLKSIIR